MSCACSGNGCNAVFCQGGQSQFLSVISSHATWHMHLYGGTSLAGAGVDGDWTPTCGDTLATYSTPGWELSFTGYSIKTLTLNSPAVVSCNNFGITANAVSWTNADAGPIYVFGYFITDSTNSFLIYAQRLAPPTPQTPYQTLLAGSVITITPQLLFGGCGCGG